MRRLLLLYLLLVGCKATEVVYVPKVHTVETIVRDTIVEVRIPEHYSEVVTLDTVSELYNPFAFSRAMVSQGRLTHTLGTRGSVTEKVKVVETIIRDTIPYPVEVIREVPRERGWWDKMLMWVGGIAIAIGVGYAIYRLSRVRG